MVRHCRARRFVARVSNGRTFTRAFLNEDLMPVGGELLHPRGG